MTERELPKFVSVDDHVVEPPHLFQTWLPKKFADDPRSPRVEDRGIAKMTYLGGVRYDFEWDESAPKSSCWFYEDLIAPHKRHVAAVGFDRDDMEMAPITYSEMRPGCYDPKARLEDMEADGVESSLCFPTFPRFCGQTFAEASDKELALACVRAYNDWMVEEWCGDADGRLIPLPLIPLWDVNLAVEEINRNAARGCTAVAFSEIPAKLGLPTLHSGYWDPFFAACNDTETLVCMHIGSSSQMPATSSDAPPAVAATLSFGNAMSSFSDYLFSGVMVRYPKLRLAYSEGQIGWLPYMIERADDVWLQHRAWGGVRDTIPEPPSTYYKDRIFGCFFRDKHGLESLASIGEDQVTFETDYPHTDSTWPYTRKIFAEQVEHLDDPTVYKIARGNAINMLRLSPDGRWRA
jgi:predicted TIM-barrel fold metal-dependent hydrolase